MFFSPDGHRILDDIEGGDGNLVQTTHQAQYFPAGRSRFLKDLCITLIETRHIVIEVREHDLVLGNLLCYLTLSFSRADQSKKPPCILDQIVFVSVIKP